MKRSARVIVPIFVVVIAGISWFNYSHPKTDPPVDKRLVSANTRFGIKLFKELAQATPNKNVFISPVSISLALSMTYNGASGGTKQEMENVMEMHGMSLDDLNNANSALLANLSNPGPGVQMNVANSLWARKGVNFERDFIQRNNDFYNAQVTTLDFGDPNAPSIIDSWVSKNTNGRIDKIVEQIDPVEILFLINAIYFKGTWMDKFDKALTKDSDFTLQNGKKIQIPMMFNNGEYEMYHNPDFSAINIPYGNGRFSMFIFLPDTDLQSFYKQLTPENWENWKTLFKKSETELGLPRFKLDYKIELIDVLSSMGMPQAFGGSANFSAMVSLPAYLTRVTHKSFLEVNEEGSEAAAATSVAIGVRAVSMPFLVNRPFVCSIVDNKTGEILFLGAIVNPTE